MPAPKEAALTADNALPTSPKPFVFVLMPFEPGLDAVYQAIKVAARAVGAYAERLNDQIFTEGMLERIFNQISKADVIVAEMTGRNANVFYEVGYAHALNKVIVLLTQEPADIPFDLKHQFHVVYADPTTDLASQLSPRLAWGISEQERRQRDMGTAVQPFAVTLSDTRLPEISEGLTLPVITRRDTRLVFGIANVGPRTTTPVEYCYLVTKSNARIYPQAVSPTGVMTGLPNSDLLEGDRLRPKFGRLHRLEWTVPALPPTAVVVLECPMHHGDRGEHPVELCLRLVLPDGPRDYPFVLNLEF